MPTKWVDFREVREKVPFQAVLDHYGVQLKPKGDQMHGFRPLPAHQGKRRSPSFSVNLERNIFQCFGCGAKGNVIDFTALMESLSPTDPSDIRKAALLLQDRYMDPDIEPPSPPRTSRTGKSKATSTPAPKATTESADPESQEGKRVIVNAPLDFTLRNLDPDHPYLKGRGLTPETIATFGLGYCNKGLMKGRIAIPLHDTDGTLIGYAGRLVDDQAIGPDTPKYLLPGTREREGTAYQFSKGLFLFNAFRLEKPVSDLVVVEGFFGAMWLHQHGFSVVAIMGSSVSETQTTLIVDLVEPAGRVWIMPDGDEAGRRLAMDLLTGVSSHRWVRWFTLREGTDPEAIPEDTLYESEMFLSRIS